MSLKAIAHETLIRLRAGETGHETEEETGMKQAKQPETCFIEPNACFTPMKHEKPQITADKASCFTVSFPMRETHETRPALPAGIIAGLDKIRTMPRPATLEGPAGEWSTLIGTCDASRCPPSLQAHRWREILADADAFLQQWGEQAAAFGWTDMDLFSVPPGPERWGRGGLIMSLRGRPVIAITEQTATIPNQSGPPHRYQRRQKFGAVMLWDERAFNDAE